MQHQQQLVIQFHFAKNYLLHKLPPKSERRLDQGRRKSYAIAERRQKTFYKLVCHRTQRQLGTERAYDSFKNTKCTISPRPWDFIVSCRISPSTSAAASPHTETVRPSLLSLLPISTMLSTSPASRGNCNSWQYWGVLHLCSYNHVSFKLQMFSSILMSLLGCGVHIVDPVKILGGHAGHFWLDLPQLTQFWGQDYRERATISPVYKVFFKVCPGSRWGGEGEEG